MGMMGEDMFARGTLCFLLVGFCLTGPVLAEEESESPSRGGSQAFKLSGYAQVLASVWKEEEMDSLRIRRALWSSETEKASNAPCLGRGRP